MIIYILSTVFLPIWTLIHHCCSCRCSFFVYLATDRIRQFSLVDYPTAHCMQYIYRYIDKIFFSKNEKDLHDYGKEVYN